MNSEVVHSLISSAIIHGLFPRVLIGVFPKISTIDWTVFHRINGPDKEH